MSSMVCLKHLFLLHLFTRKNDVETSQICCYLMMNIYIYIYSNFCSRNETLCSAGVYSCAQNRSYHLHIYIYINKERERRSVRCREREGKREKTSSHHLIVLFVYYFEIIYLLLSKRTSNKNLPVLLSLSGSYI